MGGKSSSGAAPMYDYYGSIIGVVRLGPVSTIRTLLMDGEIIWSGPINRTDAGVGNPYTLTLTDPTLLAPGGYVRFYWGDDTQTTVDPLVASHPPMRGMAYMAFYGFLFGRERVTMPNMEIIADAVALPPGSIIPATTMDTNSVNPWALLAEVLTSIHGTGLDASRLDAVSWQAVHDYFAASSDRRLLTYVAPLLTQQQQLGPLCTELLSICDGGLRMRGDGKIEAFYYPIDPGDLAQYTILDANDLTAPPDLTFESWDAVPTGVTVDFVDADQWFVQWSCKGDDLRALEQAAEPRRERLQLSFVVRHTQALQVAAEWCKRFCQPQISGSIEVRPNRAVNPDGSPLRPGDRFRLDIDPEPGGGALLQLCRVLKRKASATGAVAIDLQGEVLQPAVPYTPVYTPPGNEEIDVAALASAQIVPIPLSLSNDTAAVGLLAQRGDGLTSGAHVLFDVDGGSGTFTTLGNQIGFAVPCTVAVDYADTDTGAIRLTFTDTRDQAIALAQPGDSGAQNDQLLVVLYHLDGGGYIAENADGTPVLEWMSVQSSALVSGNTYDFTVLRSRLRTNAAAWTAGDVAWIIPRSSLVPFTHQNFTYYGQNTTDLVFRGSPYTRFGEYNGVPANLPFHFPSSWARAPFITWTTPATQSSTLGGSGDLNPAATVSDNDNNLIRLTLYFIRLDTGVHTTVFDLPFPAVGSKTLAACFTAAGVSATVNFPGQVTVDTYYSLILRATDQSGNVVEATVNLLRLATGGGSSGFTVPTISPHSQDYINTITITVTTAAPATKLQVTTTLIGSAPPGSGTTINATTYTLYLGDTRRVWARSGDGTNWSAWAYSDYTKDSGTQR